MSSTQPMTRFPESIRDKAGQADPNWLREQRRHAWELQQAGGLPSRAVHRWRYTDPKLLDPGERRVFDSQPLRDAGALEGNNAAVEIQRTLEGDATFRLSREARDAGVLVADLATAAHERTEVKRWLGQLVDAEDSVFSAMNAMLWSAGLFLRVPAGANVSLPIRMVVDLDQADGVCFTRSLIFIGENANVTLVDEVNQGSDEGRGLMLHRALELVIGSGAQVRLSSLQDAPRDMTSYNVAKARIERDADLSYTFGSFGGGISKSDFTSDLVERGARVDASGFVFGRERQSFDHHVVQRHEAGETTSKLDVRVALDDRARSAATGLLWIGPDGAGAEAYQENHNLLLSERANANSLPELEILTDDVRASHGATGGPVDPEQLYYLMTRGLTPREAEAVVVAGFFEPLLSRIPDERVEKHGRALVQDRLVV